MKRTLFPYLFLISLLLVPLSSAAQRPRRNRNAADSQAVPSYETAVNHRKAIADMEVGIAEELDEARRLFSGDTPGSEALGKKIVELENRLFTLRGQLDSLDSVITTLEGTVSGNVSKHEESSPMTPCRAMIVKNAYFAGNLSGDDYSALLSAQAEESPIDDMLRSLKENYDQLSLLLSVYYIADQGAEADSVYSRIDRLAKENDRLALSIGELWKRVFDTKIYAYNYILDKCGEKELLEGQEKQMNNLLLLQAEIEGEYMYEEAAQYALQKLLITGYEQRMADVAGLKEAADSLSALVAPTSHIEDYFMPILDTRERMFYDFADADLYRPAKYTSGTQIPTVQVFPRGNMYRVLLGIYTKAQPISIFRGVYPLSHEVKSDRRHYYYAGGYRTRSEAEESAAHLKKAGFKNPRVVLWRDGVYYENPAANESSSSGNTKSPDNRVHYRVEIAGAGESLSRIVRDVIATQAVGKEVSRTLDPANGNTLFVIGSFNNEALAQALVNEIKAVEPQLTLTVVSVP